MPKIIRLALPNGPCLIAQTRRSDFDWFINLMEMLQVEWVNSSDSEELFDDPYCVGLIEALLPLIPVYPKGSLTVDVLRQDTELFRRLFTGLGMTDAELVTLQEFEPVKRAKDDEEEGKELTVYDIPMVPSGNPDMDLLADLIHATESVSNAWMLLERLSSEDLDRLFYRLEQHGERLREPDKVINRHRRNQMDQWIEANRELYERKLRE